MVRLLIAAALFVGAASPQSVPVTYAIGAAGDLCNGGAPLVIAGGTNTVRFGPPDFTCSLPVPADGLYTVQLSFLEPCFVAGVCAGGMVNGPNQRLQDVFVNDSPVLSGFDVFTSGATNNTPSTRQYLVYSAGGRVVVRVHTVRRSGVLSGVVITPAPLATVTRSVCTGPQPPTSDCSGVEIFTINGVPYVAMMAWPEILQLPSCTSNPLTQCFQPAPLVQNIR